MQGLTDLRRQTAATANAPLGISTWYARTWAGQVSGIYHLAAFTREKLDTRYDFWLQDRDPGSSTFGVYTAAYENPFNRGPL